LKRLALTQTFFTIFLFFYDTYAFVIFRANFNRSKPVKTKNGQLPTCSPPMSLATYVSNSPDKDRRTYFGSMFNRCRSSTRRNFFFTSLSFARNVGRINFVHRLNYILANFRSRRTIYEPSCQIYISHIYIYTTPKGSRVPF